MATTASAGIFILLPQWESMADLWTVRRKMRKLDKLVVVFHNGHLAKYGVSSNRSIAATPDKKFTFQTAVTFDPIDLKKFYLIHVFHSSRSSHSMRIIYAKCEILCFLLLVLKLWPIVMDWDNQTWCYGIVISKVMKSKLFEVEPIMYLRL